MSGLATSDAAGLPRTPRWTAPIWSGTGATTDSNTPWIALNSDASNRLPRRSQSWRGARCGALGAAITSHVEEQLRPGRPHSEHHLDALALEDEISQALTRQILEALRSFVPASAMSRLGGLRPEGLELTTWRVWARAFPGEEPRRRTTSVQPDWDGKAPDPTEPGHWTHIVHSAPLLQALHEAHGMQSALSTLPMLRAAHEELHLSARPLRAGALDIPALEPDAAWKQACGLLDLSRAVFDEQAIQEALRLISNSLSEQDPAAKQWRKLRKISAEKS